ncbi:DNA polymerase III subunits gamma and tau (EC 2.7.7.7) [uncultured Gammaproteobacteria bacterium]|jgi:DNA polymerase-3 subunit gamma/tau|nr:DNA polymerase III subunits gamma and tau (EC 2.7.7.7) [uncultured Gammaproteobacteria bacterium]SHE21264.1 DNA polymerase III subunits gamma and tau [Bathymodiolus brooksi thiotrophic gill symbiont]CAC9612463.1 DNA polymerase III subunits gamma and tau (EC 2.7.7.7) [uncultured Gammaproteobacteria bacterium]CAC9615980.1 DNA polymerase III subunits gamma and tau (EC 2.7.7.7) [uncultured Gammaproteobacteria bacterium]CAC9637467.1 DNA polymerase III subunits gamma and tau (EC 2.7.7.7) [uncultur
MSEPYQVLARKYRPHTFSEMVGQIHTTKTLINALDADNLHHGFLFTGTRGVGKTTIARIFAKSINCERGVSSKPCGECATCIEIDQGQSVDLIELDAASHTGVDNMRDILENAQYMPTKNRYKIYLIDEVHMLSKSSFNALLKTLEEPPKHIKFLLATTDPQKVPITVLSRCLQFTLQKLTHEEILGQLKFIMETEKLKYEELALSQIADFGNGSMRDALSLLDQSIAYGNGTVMTKDIKAMLGLVLHDDILTLAKHLLNQDAQACINFVRELSHKGENLTQALKDLSALFHQISIAQCLDNTDIANDIQTLATKISTQDLQLFYHIAINGNKELPLAPSEQIGFEMTLLRMLAFHSNTPDKTKSVAPNKTPQTKTLEKKTPKLAPTPEIKPKTQQSTLNINSQAEWEEMANTLKFSTMAHMLIKNTVFESADQQTLTLSLDEKFSNLLTDSIKRTIQDKLQENFGKLSLNISVNKLKTQTLAQKETQAKNEKIAVLQKDFLADKGVQKLQQTFNTKVDINSIKEIKMEARNV